MAGNQTTKSDDTEDFCSLYIFMASPSLFIASLIYSTCTSYGDNPTRPTRG